MDLEFSIPGKDAPGFLRRVRRAAILQDSLKHDFSATTIDDVVAFLADFVTVPATRAEAIEALLDASSDQFEQLLTAVTGGTSPLSTPTSGTN